MYEMYFTVIGFQLKLTKVYKGYVYKCDKFKWEGQVRLTKIHNNSDWMLPYLIFSCCALFELSIMLNRIRLGFRIKGFMGVLTEITWI